MHVVLTSIHTHHSPQSMPLATAFLKSYLGTDPELVAKLNLSLVEFFVHQTAAECAAALVTLRPVAIGFSVYVWNRSLVLEIIAALRFSNPEIILFAGGPEPTADPEGLLMAGGVDFVIVGEGEVLFLQAMKAIIEGQRPVGIQRLVPAIQGGTVTIRNLDDIPSPFAEHILDLEQYDGALWQLSRGCSFMCDFCFDNKGEGKVRRFSLSRVEEELVQIVAKGVSQVFVLDSTFNEDIVRAKKILRLIARVAPRVHFHFEVRSEFIDVELAELFADLTCSLQIGLQSADPQVLRQVSRSFNPHDFSKRIELLNRSGVIFGFDLIYGLPGDTFDGFVKSLNYALRLYPNHLDIFPLAILPGTRLAERRIPGLISAAAPPYTVLESATFPAKQMLKAGDMAAAADIFYSRGKAVAWFNVAVSAFGSTPAAFLEKFWNWLTHTKGGKGVESELADQEIWQLQREFLTFLAPAGKQGSILPLLLDLVDYHYHYAMALMSPSATPRHLSPRFDPLRTTLVLSPFAQLVTFSYDINEVLETEQMDPSRFVKRFAPSGSQAVIFSDGTEIHTEVLDAPYYNLLDQLQNPKNVATMKGSGLSSGQKREFLTWAISFGLIVEVEAGAVGGFKRKKP